MNEKDYRRLSSIVAGEKIIRPVFIDKLEEKKTKGGLGDPYVRFTVSDSESSIMANKFRMKDRRPVTTELLDAIGIKEGDIVMMELEKTGDGFVNVGGMGPNTDLDVTLKDFAQKAEGDAEERFSRVIEILRSVSDERKASYGENAPISEIAIKLFLDNRTALTWSAAAELMHSEKAGGLMEHTEAMVQHALMLCEVYPDMDKELLVTAAALHDIGKIVELETNSIGRAKYTTEGIALGHIVISYTLVDRFVIQYPGVYPKERVLLLESLLLSHHGVKEFGSPVEPIVKEAFMLYYIDAMDAKYHEMKKANNGLRPGEISPGKPMGIGHRIYRPADEQTGETV